MVYPVRVGPSSGYAIVYSNTGGLINKGLEFDITGHLIKSKDFFLDLSINGQSASSKITELPVDPATGKPKTLDISNVFGRSDGRSIYDYYIREWAGVNPDDGSPQWNLYYDDKNNNGKSDSGEEISSLFEYKNKNKNTNIKKEVTGNYSQATQKYVNRTAIPDVTGGINLSTGYKGVTLRVQMLYGVGGYSYDYLYAGLMSSANQAGGNNYHVDIRNRWQKKGDITDVPRIVANEGNDRRAASPSTRFLIRSDYLQLNNIRVGYTLPKKLLKKTKTDRIYVWMSGDNLYGITARKGFIPLTSETGSTSRYTYSPLSTFSLGIKLKF